MLKTIISIILLPVALIAGLFSIIFILTLPKEVYEAIKDKTKEDKKEKILKFDGLEIKQKEKGK